MNSDADAQRRKQATQLSGGLLGELRRAALGRLQLKTVVKESHCSPVQQLSFNLCDPDCRNLFATVGKDQATVYDDTHMADHVAVVAQLALSSSSPDSEAKDCFHACAWLNSSGLSSHPYGDALLAVGGAEPCVQLISIAEAAVVAQLPLPDGAAAAELSAAAAAPGLLLVVCRDGSMQLWQVALGLCIWSTKADAFTAALHPSGSYVVSSSRSGKLSTWQLQGVVAAADAAAAAPPGGSDAALATLDAAAAAVVKHPLLGVEQGGVVDCIRFLAADRLATKTADGRMAVLHMPSGQLLSSWRVPGYGNAAASHASRCSFGHTADGLLVCVGNHNTAGYVYAAASGCQLARVEAIRVSGSVRSCGLSEDCRHLLMVVGSGYVFRFEARLGDDEAADEQTDDADDDEGDDDVPAVGDGDPMSESDGEGEQAGQQQQQQQQGKQQGKQGEQLPLLPSGVAAAAMLAGSPALPGVHPAAHAAAAAAQPGAAVCSATPFSAGGWGLQGRPSWPREPGSGSGLLAPPSGGLLGVQSYAGSKGQQCYAGSQGASEGTAAAAGPAAGRTSVSPLVFRATP